MRVRWIAALAVPVVVAVQALWGQVKDYVPVTQQMLERPSPNDWLMFSRTYDAQRYSPLNQITTANVARLERAWSRVYTTGSTGSVPIVHNGVMYLIATGGAIQALDAASGDILWEHKKPGQNRSKALSIFGDVVVYTAQDSNVVGLDAKTGEIRWETKTDTRSHTSGTLVADGKVISGGACGGNRANCYIAAHDAVSGKEVWRFYTTPAPGEPGDESWNGADVKNRQASTWGLPGAYDPASKTLIWGIANPMPDERRARHQTADGTSKTAPADLYSNSTVAIDVETGKLKWYYQHLPADDSDLDHTNERTLVRVKMNPDPKFVKWINPAIKKGEERDVAVTIAEGGGLSLVDRKTGEFLWATPFPFDTPEFHTTDIDVKTGRATINWDNIIKGPGEIHTICYWNTRSYWPTAYSPVTNSLYTSYIDNCREVTSGSGAGAAKGGDTKGGDTKGGDAKGGGGRGGWKVVQRPGGNPNELTGMAKIDLSTGEILRFDVGRAPGFGAVLATAGGLIFHGDMSRKFKAFDAKNGKELWSTTLDGYISVSTITYAVNGRQYVAVMTGDNAKTPELANEVPELKAPGHNELYVFALPAAAPAKPAAK